MREKPKYFVMIETKCGIAKVICQDRKNMDIWIKEHRDSTRQDGCFTKEGDPFFIIKGRKVELVQKITTKSVFTL